MSKKELIKYHNDSSIWAKGLMDDGLMEGYWEGFRNDGSKMRSWNFEKGRQVGEWVTYDKNGKIIKTTLMENK